MASTSPVGDALIGSRHWTDSQVTRMVETLLGPDDDTALQLLESVQIRLVEAIKAAWPFVCEREIKAVGNKSYFANQGHQRPEADSNLPATMSLTESEELSDESVGERPSSRDVIRGIVVSDADAEYEEE
jgi:hypothetical protein